jgi:hypothetical protein
MLFTVFVVGICVFAGVKFVLDSYYLGQVEPYERSLLPKTEQLDQVRAHDMAAIEKGERGNIPVSVAMQTLAAKGRDNASELITPKQSDDVDPLKGWAKLKHEVNLPPQQATSAAPEQPAPPIGDAGAAATGDAGAHPTMTGDAGAPAPMMKDGGAPQHPAPQNAKDGGK